MNIKSGNDLIMKNLKSTPLNAKHVLLGAKMVPFGGWDMPVQYSEGILAEHRHTRKQVSLFDTCHMGEFIIKGPSAAADLDWIFPRAVANQKVGTARYNFLLSDHGTVLDDLLIYRMDEEEFLIVVNAGTIDNDATRLRSLLSESTELIDESPVTGKLDLQGPLSADILEKLGFKKNELPKNYKWIKTSINGIPTLLSRTGYTGELGFEFYVSSDKINELWNILTAFSEVKPAGLGARDTLRLEAGFPLYGNEMDEETTPVEAGFSPMIGLEKRTNFIAENILKDPSKITKILTPIILEGRRAARHGNAVSLMDGREIGIVTSGMFSPLLEKAIALAYIKSEHKLQVDDEVLLKVGTTTLPGRVVTAPFYKDGTVRMKI
jgi:aminomethyltransferase